MMGRRCPPLVCGRLRRRRGGGGCRSRRIRSRIRPLPASGGCSRSRRRIHHLRSFFSICSLVALLRQGYWLPLQRGPCLGHVRVCRRCRPRRARCVGPRLWWWGVFLALCCRLRACSLRHLRLCPHQQRSRRGGLLSWSSTEASVREGCRRVLGVCIQCRGSMFLLQGTVGEMRRLHRQGARLTSLWRRQFRITLLLRRQGLWRRGRRRRRRRCKR